MGLLSVYVGLRKMLNSRVLSLLEIVRSRKFIFSSFSSSIVYCSFLCIWLNSFKTALILVIVWSCAMSVSSTNRKYPRILLLISIPVMKFSSIYCRKTSDNIAEECAPIAKPSF
jgi:hypothetical protein